MALLGLQLNRLCKMALLAVCVSCVLSPAQGHLPHARAAGSAGDPRVRGHDMPGVSWYSLGGLVSYRRTTKAYVAFGTEQGWDRSRVLEAGECYGSFELNKYLSTLV